MASGVYIIRNTQNGKVYVGSSVDMEERWKVHRQRLRQGMTTRLGRAWTKYGERAFEFKVIEEVTPGQLIEREQYWIDTMLAYSFGYNSRPKARTCLGMIRGAPSKEHRHKNAEAHTGSRNPNWGTHRSEETKRRISEAQKDKPRPRQGPEVQKKRGGSLRKY